MCDRLDCAKISLIFSAHTRDPPPMKPGDPRRNGGGVIVINGLERYLERCTSIEKTL